MRVIVAATVALSVAGATFVTLDAHASPCRYQRLDPGTWTPRESRRTVGCFAEVFRVDSETAHRIAYRESRYHARAWNRSGCSGHGCLGLYQHHALYWPARLQAASDALRRYGVRKRFWTNPRVMAVVTFVHVRRYGWGAW